jgi:hypothetical protein
MLIGAEWVESASGRTFPTIDPATGEEIAQVPHGEAEDVSRAVAAARKAFEEGPWATTMTAAQRSRILYRVAELLSELLVMPGVHAGSPNMKGIFGRLRTPPREDSQPGSEIVFMAGSTERRARRSLNARSDPYRARAAPAGRCAVEAKGSPSLKPSPQRCG